MNYLLDTNVLSEPLKKRPDAGVARRLGSLSRAQLYTSSVCVMELRAGAQRHSTGPELWTRISRDVLRYVTVLPFAEAEGRRAGDVIARLALIGKPIGVEDVMIAATALEHDLVIATRNVGHLSRVEGARVESWW